MKVSLDLVGIQSGSIEAPAGCGKTTSIANLVSASNAKKPILILTHTNAGVMALQEKLRERGVAASRYKLATLDGWSRRLVSFFPLRSGCPPAMTAADNPNVDYGAIRKAALGLLVSGHVDRVIANTYSSALIDEYQDCDMLQHKLCANLKRLMPVSIFGDELQRIFGWDSEMPLWADVLSEFPVIHRLSTPHRWYNEGAHLFGDWLLGIRSPLENGQPIDLRQAQNGVIWRQVSEDNPDDVKLRSIRYADKISSNGVLVICDEKRKSRLGDIAKRVFGASVVEAAELPTARTLANNLEPLTKDALPHLINFAATCATGVRQKDMTRRVATLLDGRSRKPATELEATFAQFARQPSVSTVRAIFSALASAKKIQVIRWESYRAVEMAIRRAPEGCDLKDRILKSCEQRRLLGRSIRGTMVGSTLLLKGLQAEVVVIADTENLSRENLYVALTRGSKKVIICSRSPVLSPS